MKGRAKRAWVVRWEWIGDHARVEQPVAAVLSPRLGHESVARIVEALYAAREYQPAEMLEASRRRGFNPYPAKLGTVRLELPEGTLQHIPWQGEVLCGNNPWLAARLAWVRDDPDRPGGIVFDDGPRPGATRST